MMDIWRRLRQGGTLSPAIRQAIEETYAERGVRALAALDEGRVKKYLDFFVVVGQTGEYVVEDDFCTCRDFTFRGKMCWHILAVKIALIVGGYEEYSLWYQDTWSRSE
jgi:predicted nucleic acid-binding Zn finger protein